MAQIINPPVSFTRLVLSTVDFENGAFYTLPTPEAQLGVVALGAVRRGQWLIFTFRFTATKGVVGGLTSVRFDAGAGTQLTFLDASTPLFLENPTTANGQFAMSGTLLGHFDADAAGALLAIHGESVGSNATINAADFKVRAHILRG